MGRENDEATLPQLVAQFEVAAGMDEGGLDRSRPGSPTSSERYHVRMESAAAVSNLDADSFYFPPGRSMARRVHGERSVGLLYGQRALVIGALEPLTYTGTMLSTRSADRPFERLARTAKIQEAVLLGTCKEADEALAAVHRVHEHVKGSLPEAAGPHPAGTAYSAFDPELMLWTPAPRVQGLVGGKIGLARVARDPTRAGTGAAGRLPSTSAGGGAGQHRHAEPHHQGHAAVTGERDSRHPMEYRP
jgi:hypothetical protein